MSRPVKGRETTLVINRSSSHCGACGRGANPREETHESVPAWSDAERAKPGCGVRWTHVDTDYVGIPGLRESIVEMRPDLKPEGVINVNWPPK